MSWTPEKVELLRALHAAGLSGSLIGARLGATRSAVIGKLHRLGLSRHSQPRLRKKTVSGRRNRRKAPWFSKPPNPAQAADRAARMMAEYEAIRQAPELFIPEPERKTLETLEPSSCRYPYGDPRTSDFYFCGRSAIEGLSYCDHHRQVCFVPITTRAQRAEFAKQKTARSAPHDLDHAREKETA